MILELLVAISEDDLEKSLELIEWISDWDFTSVFFIPFDLGFGEVFWKSGTVCHG